MPKYRLHEMSGWQAFEELVGMLCQELLGNGTVVFSTGPDGGRDGVFEGTANRFPSVAKPWKGHFLIQAKWTELADASCSDSSFTKIIKAEKSRIINRRKDGEADNYLLFTNRKCTAGKHRALIKKLRSTTKVKHIHLFARNTIHLLLARFPKIAAAFNLLGDPATSLPIQSSVTSVEVTKSPRAITAVGTNINIAAVEFTDTIALVQALTPLVNRYENKRAAEVIETLQQRYQSLSLDQKCTINIQKARLHLRKGLREQAFSNFDAAEACSPERADQKSWIAYGYYMRGDIDGSKKWVVEALKEDPTDSRANMLSVLCAPPTRKASELQKEVAVDLSTDSRVAFALGMRFMGEDNTIEAERWLKRSTAIDPSWSEPLSQLAFLQVMAFERNGGLVRAFDPQGPHEDGIVLALDYAERALQVCSKSGDVESTCRANLLLARIKCYMGDNDAMDIFLRAAEQLNIVRDEVLRAKMQLFGMAERIEESEAIAKGIVDSNGGVTHNFLTALSILRESKDPCNVDRARAKLREVAFASDIVPGSAQESLSVMALKELALLSIRSNDSETLQLALSAPLSSKFSLPEFLTLSARFAAMKGNWPDAVAHLTKGANSLSDDWDLPELLESGRVAQAGSEWLLAAQFFRAFLNRKFERTLALDYLSCLQNTGDLAEICKYSECLRSQGHIHHLLLQYELFARAQLDPNGVAALITEVVRTRPGDKNIRLIGALFAVELNRRESVKVDVTLIPSPLEVATPEIGGAALRVLAAYQLHDAAKVYAYALLQRFPKEPSIFRAIIGELYVRATDTANRIALRKVVDQDCAVKLLPLNAKDDTSAFWVVVEASPGQLPNVLSAQANDQLGAALMGCKVGAVIDNITIRDVSGAFKIQMIVSKYDLLPGLAFAEFPRVFPHLDDVVVFKVDEADPVGGLQRELAKLDGFKQKHDQRTSIIQTMKALGGPLITVAKLLGLNPVEFVDSISHSTELKLVASPGALAEWDAAQAVCKECDTVVVSPSAALIVAALGKNFPYKKLRQRMIIGPIGLESLKSWASSCRTREMLTFTDDLKNIGIVQRSSPDELVADLNDLLKHIEGTGCVESASAGVDMPSNQRKELLRFVGREETEALVLATSGRALWCDDALVAAVVAKEASFNRRVWTDVLLEHAFTQTDISEAELLTAKREMLSKRYWFTRLHFRWVPMLLARAKWDAADPTVRGICLCVSDAAVTDEDAVKNLRVFVLGAFASVGAENDIRVFVEALLTALHSRKEGQTLVDRVDAQAHELSPMNPFVGARLRRYIATWKKTQIGDKLWFPKR